MCSRISLFVLLFMMMTYLVWFLRGRNFRGWFQSMSCIGLKFSFLEIWDYVFFRVLIRSSGSNIQLVHHILCRGLLVRFFALLGGRGDAFVPLASRDLHMVTRTFLVSHARSDFVNDSFGLSCCFRGNVMSCHISLS